MAMPDRLKMKEEYFVMIRRDDGTPVMCKSFDNVDNAIGWAKDIVMNAYPTCKADIEIQVSSKLCEISIKDAMLWKASQFEKVDSEKEG